MKCPRLAQMVLDNACTQKTYRCFLVLQRHYRQPLQKYTMSQPKQEIRELAYTMNRSYRPPKISSLLRRWTATWLSRKSKPLSLHPGKYRLPLSFKGYFLCLIIAWTLLEGHDNFTSTTKCGWIFSSTIRNVVQKGGQGRGFDPRLLPPVLPTLSTNLQATRASTANADEWQLEMNSSLLPLLATSHKQNVDKAIELVTKHPTPKVYDVLCFGLFNLISIFYI